MNKLIDPIIIKEQEIWVPISGIVLENIQPWYFISTLGRIYSDISNKMLSPFIDRYGYAVVCMHRQDKTHISQFVHRLVLLSYQYTYDHMYLQTNHINGNKLDNRLCNLEWCTAKENVIHAHRTGLAKGQSGENNPMATITNVQADKIARLICTQKYSNVEISEMIGCSINVVESISRGESWREYYDKYNLGDIRRLSSRYTNQQLHHICKYFEDNINDNISKNKLYSNALYGLGIEYNESMRKTMSGILNKKIYKNITSQYNY